MGLVLGGTSAPGDGFDREAGFESGLTGLLDGDFEPDAAFDGGGLGGLGDGAAGLAVETVADLPFAVFLPGFDDDEFAVEVGSFVVDFVEDGAFDEVAGGVDREIEGEADGGGVGPGEPVAVAFVGVEEDGEEVGPDS